MKVIQSTLLIAAGMVAALAIQGAVPGLLRATAEPLRQQVTPMPTPVPPNVIVTNEPTVNAKQAGPWTFQLSAEQPLAMAPMQVAAPAFLHAGGQYAFYWAPGATPGVYTVKSAGPGGWVLIAGDAGEVGAMWINAARAIRIERVGG